MIRSPAKLVLLILFGLGSVGATQAEQLASIEGKVTEAATQTPVRKASVSLITDSEELVAATDDAGVFR